MENSERGRVLDIHPSTRVSDRDQMQKKDTIVRYIYGLQ